MFGHLKDEALLDAVLGQAGERAARHLRECVACRERVDSARATLRASAEADVPEPPPLFWESFRGQVGRRIATEPRRGVPLVPAFAALAAALLLALGLWNRTQPPNDVSRAPSLPAWSALPALEDDIGAQVIQALVVSEDDLPFLACRGLECLEELTEEESRAVVEALRVELGGRAL